MIRAAVFRKKSVLALSNSRCVGWKDFKRTGSVLAAADLDELLDVGDLGRHVGGFDGLVSGMRY